MEINDEIENFETGDEDMRNENDDNADVEAEDQEIAGVQNPYNNDGEEENRRGKRKRSRNPCYFNSNTVNTIMMEKDFQDNELISQEKLYGTSGENVMATIFEYILAQYSFKWGLKNMESWQSRQPRKNCHKYIIWMRLNH